MFRWNIIFGAGFAKAHVRYSGPCSRACHSLPLLLGPLHWRNMWTSSPEDHAWGTAAAYCAAIKQAAKILRVRVEMVDVVKVSRHLARGLAYGRNFDLFH